MKNNYMMMLLLLIFIGLGQNVKAKETLKESKKTGIYNVLDYKAIGDGIYLTTGEIQKAIDECSKAGGGEVIVPAGEYLIGTLELKSNVTLHLLKGATISGSKNVKDYTGGAVIHALNAVNIGLKGEGVINGNGEAYPDKQKPRVNLIVLESCNQVRIDNLELKSAGAWTCSLKKCDGVLIKGVHLLGHGTWNNDGIDINAKNVVISDCIIDAQDDAIVFKNPTDTSYVVENITVTNCVIASNCNFIKIGTETKGGFRNITISNCTLHGPMDIKWEWYKTNPGVTKRNVGISGIALEIVDGGFMDQVAISNITMRDIQTPIFIRLGKRNRGVDPNKKGSLSNVIISNVIATSESFIASSITGLEDMKVENVILSNIILNLKGGGKRSESVNRDSSLREVPEVPAAYPENTMFGWRMLPAYGFYIRHVNNITLDNVQLKTYSGKEERNAIVADDVNGLRIINSIIEAPKSDLPVISLIRSKNVRLFNDIILGPSKSVYGVNNMDESEVKSFQVEVQ